MRTLGFEHWPLVNGCVALCAEHGAYAPRHEAAVQARDRHAQPACLRRRHGARVQQVPGECQSVIQH